MSRLRSQNSALMSVALGLGSALWIAAACGEIETEERWPDGAALLADTRSLDRLLEQVAQLEGTPLARRAERLRASLPSCKTVEGRAETGELSDLWPALTCRVEGSDFGALERARNGWDLAVSAPIGDVNGSVSYANNKKQFPGIVLFFDEDWRLVLKRKGYLANLVPTRRPPRDVDDDLSKDDPSDDGQAP